MSKKIKTWNSAKNNDPLIFPASGWNIVL